MTQVGKSQLDTYLEEANIPNKYHPNLDVLQYWKDNQAVSRSLIIGLWYFKHPNYDRGFRIGI